MIDPRTRPPWWLLFFFLPLLGGGSAAADGAAPAAAAVAAADAVDAVETQAPAALPTPEQLAEPTAEERSAVEEQAAKLPKEYQDWLGEMADLILPAEREVFLGLTKDYQREAFIRRFWQVRDPFPETGRNEFMEWWQTNRQLATQLFDNLTEDRARMLMLNGEPTERHTNILCPDHLNPLEIWYYQGTPRIRLRFYLVFYERRGRREGMKLWYPRQGLEPLRKPIFGSVPTDAQMLETILTNCARGDLVASAVVGAADWERVMENVEVVPKPSEEWVRTFVAYSTEVPEGAELFPAELEVSFPGRHQSRTVLQGLVTVHADDVAVSNLVAKPSYNFVVDGEILLKGALFEHFRYRFNLTADQLTEDGQLPLVVQRLLRPGVYQLVLKVEDLNGERYFRKALELEVPQVDPTTLPPAVAAVGDAAVNQVASRAQSLLSEANAEITTGDHSLRLHVPEFGLMVGKVRVDARTAGEGIDKVRFVLNGRPIFTKSRPPYSVELDLGTAPQIHTVRATAFNSEGRVLATDEALVNAGPHRFSVRLIEPQRGHNYQRSLRASAIVEVPEGERLDRVEMYLNETLVATLYQPPFVQPMVIPAGEPLAYVRALAYLDDGASTEDAVFVNAPDYVDEVNIQMVELYTSVLDRRGRPVEGLTREDFTVFENGTEQELRRFELVENVPVHAGILLDVSRSMLWRLDAAQKGALRFFETVIEPKDRAAVITFNEKPQLVVRFTNDLEVLAGGLAGLTAEGETALYDSLIYSLYYFSGLTGKRAIIILSDGADSASRYTFDDVIDYARRVGVSLYSIGIDLSGGKTQDIRLNLERLSRETGGTAFFIDSEKELERVYTDIQAELRSQYLLAYQSNAPLTGGGGDFREVEVKTRDDSMEAKTINGYFP